MTFSTILKSIYKQYNLDFCKVADALGIEDDVVLSWEEGKSLPNEKQLQDFSDAYIIPMSILQKSIKGE